MASKKSGRKMRIRKEVFVIGAIIILIGVGFAAKYLFGGSDDIAAKVNGENIMKEDVIREYLKVPVEYRQIIPVDSILRGMIIEKLLLQEAKKEGITVSNEELELNFREMLAAYGATEEDVIASLNENGDTLSEFKNVFMERLVMNKLLEEIVFGSIEVGSSEARDYYDNNLAQFGSPDQIRASHILVDTESEANSLRNKALGGMDFASLARDYSKCPSSSQGGDLGWFGMGQMVAEFENAAFALEKINSISKVVQTQFGFHIIKLTGIEKGSVKPFEEVEEEIKSGLLQQKKSYAADIYTAQLEANAVIEIFMKNEQEEPLGIPVTKLNSLSQQQAGEGVGNEAEIEVIDVVLFNESASEGGNEFAVEYDLAEEEPAVEDEVSYSSVGFCLSAKGAVMYGSDSSSASLSQKELFGDDFSNVIYVDCIKDESRCSSAGIISYPTWVLNSQKKVGKYSLASLASWAGC